MTRVAADPSELRSLASLHRDLALELVSQTARLHGDLPSMPPAVAAVAGDVLESAGQRLTLVADGLMEQGQVLESAAHFFELADMPGLGTTYAHMGYAALTSAIAPDGSLAEWSVLDWIGIEAGATPAQIATAFAALDATQRSFLVQSYPGAVGSLDGAPLEMRFAANRILVGQGLSDLAAERDRLEARLAELSDGWRGGLAGKISYRSQLVALQRELGLVTGKLDTLSYLADGLASRQILLFDASGDGRVAEVFGDVATARHIAVVLPGVSNDLTNYREGLRGMAGRLWDEGSRMAGDVAVVSWLGYDPPDTVVDGAFPQDAIGAARDLRRSVDGLRAHVNPENLTVVGHSYGSVVTGRAIRDEGLEVTDAVFVGSPGVAWDVDHRSDLGGGVGDVWVAEAPKDPVPDFPVVHGPNPADDEWGGRRFETNAPGSRRVEGHSAYLEAGGESLRNIARIIVGADDEVGS